MADDLLYSLFASICDYGNHEQRCVDNTDVDRYRVDTSYTSDYGYETAVCSDEHDWIVVERYSTKEEAQKGHDRWVKKCEEEKPTQLWSIQYDSVEEI